MVRGDLNSPISAADWASTTREGLRADLGGEGDARGGGAGEPLGQGLGRRGEPLEAGKVGDHLVGPQEPGGVGADLELRGTRRGQGVEDAAETVREGLGRRADVE